MHSTGQGEAWGGCRMDKGKRIWPKHETNFTLNCETSKGFYFYILQVAVAVIVEKVVVVLSSFRFSVIFYGQLLKGWFTPPKTGKQVWEVSGWYLENKIEKKNIYILTRIQIYLT